MTNISDLQDGMKKVAITAVVAEVGDTRTVKSRYKDEEYQIADATITDDTGSIKLVLWNEQIEQVREKVGSSITIENGYITEFKGEIQLNIGKFGTLKA